MCGLIYSNGGCIQLSARLGLMHFDRVCIVFVSCIAVVKSARYCKVAENKCHVFFTSYSK